MILDFQQGKKPYDPNKKTIAVLCSSQNCDHGLVSGLTSEGRMSLNYAWMLAYQGHAVDLIGLNGISYLQMILGMDPITPTMPNLKLIGIDNPRDKKSHYDICIAHDPFFCEKIPDADIYILFTFDVGLSISNIRTVDLKANPWAVGKKTIKCFPFKGSKYFYPYNMFDQVCDDYPVFPQPVPGNWPIKNNFSCKEVIWTCKHIHGFDDAFETGPLNLKKIASFMFAVLRQYTGEYQSNFILPSLRDSFPNIKHVGGLNYHHLFECMANCKIAFNAYHNGSVVESVANGCLPLVWKHEYDIIRSPGLNWEYSKEADQMGCLLKASDGVKIIRDKIHRLITDEKYYGDVLACFQDTAYDHTFEGSYKYFEKLLEEAK